mgnify:CR=1 FL=1
MGKLIDEAEKLAKEHGCVFEATVSEEPYCTYCFEMDPPEGKCFDGDITVRMFEGFARDAIPFVKDCIAEITEDTRDENNS